MIDLEEIREALKGETNASITELVKMSWHHQIKGRQRVPEAMDEWQHLIDQWLTSFDRDVAAQLIHLMTYYDLKAGNLPPNYDPESAELLCKSLVRSQGDYNERRMMRAYGSDTLDLSIGKTISF